MKANDRVIYVPNHAHGDVRHEDCETGTISSFNMVGDAFVKFDKQVSKFGWEGTTSQCCSIENLVPK